MTSPRPLVPATILAVLLVAVNLTLVATFSPDRVSNDGAQYLSEARNILAGRGFATDIAYYDEHHRLGRFPVPQTVFPPGYPLAIAAAAATGLADTLAAFVVCLLAFNLCVAFTWLGTREASKSQSLAALAGIVVAGSVTAGVQVAQCASEMPFVAATLAGLACLQRLSRGGPWPPLAAGLAAAAAVSVRYAGLFFLAALAVVMLARLARLRSRSALGDLALAVGPGALTAAALLARNHLLVGDAMGGNAFLLSRPAAEVLSTFARGVQGLVGYSRARLEAGGTDAAWLVAVVIALVGVAIAARPEWRGGLRQRLLRDEGVGLAFAYWSVSLVALWQLERTRYLGVSSRMLLPLVPFALVLAAAAASAVRWRKPRLGAGALAALLAVVYLAGQARLLPPRDVMRREATLRGLRQSLAGSETAGRLLSQDAERRRPFLTNEPQPLGVFLHQPIVGLTPAQYTGTRWTPEATERLVRRYGVRHVVFFRRVFEDSEKEARGERANQDVFRSLANGEVPRWLSPIQSDGDLQLFEVRE